MSGSGWQLGRVIVPLIDLPDDIDECWIWQRALDDMKK